MTSRSLAAFNAQARLLRRSGPGKWQRALALVDSMRADGHAPNNFTLQSVFACGRGEASGVSELLDVLMTQMRKGDS